MAGHHTFHTPSFGDEEFELPQLQQNNQAARLMRNNLTTSVNVATAEIQPSAVVPLSAAAAAYDLTNVVNSGDFVEPTMNYSPFPQQWSLPSPLDHVVSRSDSLSSEFLVSRSQQQQHLQQVPSQSQIQQQPSSGIINVSAINSSSVLSSPASNTSAAFFMQPTTVETNLIEPPSSHGSTHAAINSSDESDDNTGGNKSNAKSESLKNKIKNDPNAPRKPVSAYAMFFGDTQAAIKGQNPNASFADISKIVASMWDALAPEHKEVYRKKAEDAKKEYRKQLSIYRANVLSRHEEEQQQQQQRLASSMDTISPNRPPITTSATGVSAVQTNAPSLNVVGNIGHHNQQPPVTPTTLMSLQSPTSNSLMGGMNSMRSPTETNTTSMSMVTTQNCIRNGCQNLAIVSADWEDEYCSNECVVSHCREIFTRWVQDNASAEAFAAN